MYKLDQASKEAWQWVENTEVTQITDEHIKLSYRLKVQPCKLGKCKKNCKHNPQCLTGLGEKIWQEDLKISKEEPEDPCNIIRTSGNFVGLTNLGATCYVNSLLQLWFHNPYFRKAVYSWVPVNDPSEILNPTISKIYEGGYNPSSPIGNLQLLFALMQFSKRSCVNPASFVTSLGIDITAQQDAQEFSKLFVCMLEEKLSHQPDSMVSSMVQKQFRGQYEYVTRCCNCLKESSSPSPFYELDLPLGSKTNVTLMESLKEFLQEEKLEGLDQYFCSYCGSKQNARRKIRLRHLPPVLNIQLLRFVFDRKTGHKKKLSSAVHFPEVIEMNPYVFEASSSIETTPETANKLTYDLVAVLIHRGPSAYSGHYIAHIRDSSSAWYKFNDEIVQKLEGPKLKLGIEDDDDQKKVNVAASKVSKGIHVSSNAYMLVYCLRNGNKLASKDVVLPDCLSKLPTWIQTSVACENDNFEAWNRDVFQRKKENLKMSQEKHSQMRKMYCNLPSASIDSGDFVNVHWLSRWLRDEEKLGPLDNGPLLCSHSKLNPDKFKEFKIISSQMADILYSQYQGGPRLKRDSLCRDCITIRCKTTRLRSQLDSDSKVIANLMKTKIDLTATNYWIGKESIKSWKRLVLERMVSQSDELKKTEKTNGKSAPVAQADGALVETKRLESQWQAEFLKSLEERPTSSDSMEWGFNDDLLCRHGRLSIEETPRRLIQPAVREIFHRYFPEAPEFKSNDPACELCTKLADEEVKTKEHYKRIASEQRTNLQDLLKHKNRPNLSLESVSQVYILAKDTVEKWRAFIKDPVRKEPVLSLSNSSIICPHGGLLYRLSCPEQEVDPQFVLLWPVEWEELGKFTKVDQTILVKRLICDGAVVEFNVDPAVCETCLAKRLEEVRRSQLNYDRAVIYVRQICPNDSLNKSGTFDGTSVSHSIEGEDPDFKMESENKKPRLDGPITAATSSRRSQRQRRVRGEKEVTVSCHQTLLDLKREILKKFRIAPFDQHLTCNGRELNDNQATLATLRIYPGTVIILQTDELCEDPSAMEDYSRTAIPEEGFKGTELLRS